MSRSPRAEGHVAGEADGTKTFGLRFGTLSSSLGVKASSLTWVEWERVLKAAACSVLWMAVSSALIVLNKQLLSVVGFHYPMALSGLGMAFSSVAGFVVCKILKLVQTQAHPTITPLFYCKNILPIGLFMALTLHFGNVVYLYLTMSFIQILKAFTPIVTMLVLFVAGLETLTVRLVTALALVTFGTALASLGEVNLSVVGIACMLASETFEAVRLVMTQILLVEHKFHPIEGLMYLAPACAFWLFLGVVVLEWPTMLREGAITLVAQNPAKFCAAAVMGFGVNSLAYAVIQLSSSLTLKVLATVKNGLVVWIGIIFWQEVVTSLQGVGWGISLVGFAMYNHLKMQPARVTQPQSPRHQYEEVPAEDDIESSSRSWQAQRPMSRQLSGDFDLPVSQAPHRHQAQSQLESRTSSNTLMHSLPSMILPDQLQEDEVSARKRNLQTIPSAPELRRS